MKSPCLFAPNRRCRAVGYVDFMPAVWYKKRVQIPADWNDQTVLTLHFGAVDYDATVWINGVEVGQASRRFHAL